MGSGEACGVGVAGFDDHAVHRCMQSRRISRERIDVDRDRVRRILKAKIEEARILQRLPKDLAALFGTDESKPQSAGDRPASAIR